MCGATTALLYTAYVDTGAANRLASDFLNLSPSTSTLTNLTAVSIPQSVMLSSSAVTTTNANSLYIAGAPIANTNVTATNLYALNVASGTTTHGGPLTFTSKLGTGNGGSASSSVNYIAMNDNPVFLRPSTDKNHFLSYGGTSGGYSSIDGPLLVGYAGGCLGASNSGLYSLTWDNSGNIVVRNNITLSGGIVVNGYYAGAQTANGGGGTYYRILNTFTSSTSQLNNIYAISCSNNYYVQAGEFHATSSEKIKTRLTTEPLAEAVEKLRQLPLTKYKYKDEVKNNNGEIYGLIAEDVQQVFPEYVKHNESIVPNIYQVADCSNLDNGLAKLTFDKPLDFGDRRLDELLVIHEKDDDTTENIILKKGEFWPEDGGLVIKTKVQMDRCFVYGTHELCPTIAKNYLFELGLCVNKYLLQENDQLKSRLDAIEEQLKRQQ